MATPVPSTDHDVTTFVDETPGLKSAGPALAPVVTIEPGRPLRILVKVADGLITSELDEALIKLTPPVATAVKLMLPVLDNSAGGPPLKLYERE